MATWALHLKNIIAVCDVDKEHGGKAKERVEKAGVKSCAVFGDYRKLLEMKEVDAVVVSTPDHWHALPTIHACEAGKDVYTEKPLSLTVAEGRAMVQAARKHKRIVQTGSQQRSDAKFRLGCELVRNGHIGMVHTVRVGIPGVNFKGPAVADSEPPAELDYETWLGPAPMKPYNKLHVHYNFRFFWDYSGGQMTNWGAHHLDIAQWGLGMDDSGPVTVEGKGQFQKDKWYEVPEKFEIVYKYANGVTDLLLQRPRQRRRDVRGREGHDPRQPRRPGIEAGRDRQGETGRGRRAPLRQQQPSRQLARLYQDSQAADLRRGDRPSFRYRVPPG